MMESIVATFKQLIKIITEQDGYILSSEDMLAVSRMCGGIAVFMLLVSVIVVIVRYKKSHKDM